MTPQQRQLELERAMHHLMMASSILAGMLPTEKRDDVRDFQREISNVIIRDNAEAGLLPYIFKNAKRLGMLGNRLEKKQSRKKGKKK